MRVLTWESSSNNYTVRKCICINIYQSINILLSYVQRLDQLATASSLVDTLKELQEVMQGIREDVNRLKTNGPTLPPWEMSAVTLHSSNQDPLRESRARAGQRKWIYSTLS